MDGETNGSQETTQGTQDQAQQQQREGAQAQGESDRIDFKLQLAGVRNVKAARAILADHDNDIDKLKEPSRSSSRRRESAPRTAPARPGFPTPVRPPTPASSSSTGVRLPGSPTRATSRRRAKPYLAASHTQRTT